MTCRYTETQWRDALYNAVRATSGGVKAAAVFLSDRRGVAIHAESLRRKLRGEDTLDVEVAQMLGEYIATDARAHGQAKNWLLALCAEEGLHVDDVPPAPEGGWEDEAKALQDKALAITAKIGKVAGVTAQSTADGRVEQHEADQLVPLLRAVRVISHRMERNVLRAVEKSRGE
ncbi:hypothetical protein NJI34_34590 [Pseudomonas sp. S 311-6]|nr:hypothetical protein [Pseudomonas sp. S 311-6]